MDQTTNNSLQDLASWEEADIRWAQNYLDRNRFKPEGKCLEAYLENHSGGKNNFHQLSTWELKTLLEKLPNVEIGGHKLITNMAGAWKQRARRKVKRSVSFELPKSVTDALGALAKQNKIPQHQVLSELIRETYWDEKQLRDDARNAKKQASRLKKREKAKADAYTAKYKSFNGGLMSALSTIDGLQEQITELEEKLKDTEIYLEMARHQPPIDHQ